LIFIFIHPLSQAHVQYAVKEQEASGPTTGY
jgi:hypothetical protein